MTDGHRRTDAELDWEGSIEDSWHVEMPPPPKKKESLRKSMYLLIYLKIKGMETERSYQSYGARSQSEERIISPVGGDLLR